MTTEEMTSGIVEHEIIEQEQKIEIASLMRQDTEPHLLENSWTLWYDIAQGRPQGNWIDNLKKLSTFMSVEGFWSVFNNIVEASKLSSGANYHLFKEGIMPEWEDKENANGGKWVVFLDRKNIENEQLFNQIWLYTVLACVGETLEFSEDVAGVVASVRKPNFRLSIWTKTAANGKICMSLGKQLKEAFDTKVNLTLEYQSHNEVNGQRITYQV